jgi:O-antigen/teichoic acid export membrane protein
MLQQLKRLGSETAMYGTSTIVGRFLNFLLVPFYTNVLQPGEYGIVTYVYSIIAFVNVIYAYGMESAFFKYASTRELGPVKKNFSTAFLSLISTSVVFSFVLLMLNASIGTSLQIPEQSRVILFYAIGMLAFDTMSIIPFAVLRMEHKAKQFAAIKVLNIVINVVMNIVLLVGYHCGIVGIFISGVTASLATFLVLLPTVFRNISFGINTGLLKALLKFGLPSVPAGLSAMAVQVIDRPILRALTDDATVGIYQANYRLGIFMMLIVQMYDYAWRPFYFSAAQEENAKEIFSRVLTYLILFMSIVFLFLTLFIYDIVKISFFGRHLIHPSYWSGLSLVPIVLLGYFFLGIYTNVSAGIYIQKKTVYLPVITLVGALVNIGANFLLIPSMGMIGAAWATFWAYFGMALVAYLVARRVYPVIYEWNRILKIFLTLSIIAALYYYVVVSMDASVLRLLVKLSLVGMFIGSMFILKFFKQSEVTFMKNMLRIKPIGTGDDNLRSD